MKELIFTSDFFKESIDTQLFQSNRLGACAQKHLK